MEPQFALSVLEKEPGGFLEPPVCAGEGPWTPGFHPTPCREGPRLPAALGIRVFPSHIWAAGPVPAPRARWVPKYGVGVPKTQDLSPCVPQLRLCRDPPPAAPWEVPGAELELPTRGEPPGGAGGDPPRPFSPCPCPPRWWGSGDTPVVALWHTGSCSLRNCGVWEPGCWQRPPGCGGGAAPRNSWDSILLGRTRCAPALLGFNPTERADCPRAGRDFPAPLGFSSP